ncbi:hypothetical protein DMJ13_05945 [halophilic archaeon]|nr:hypothetical protein DMJ13_05945 [halophilic archaeon]
MDRRRFVGLLGVASVAGLGGCLAELVPVDGGEERSRPVGLVVRSYFEEQRTVDVNVDDADSETEYNEEFTLLPGDVARRKGLFEAGTYQVSAGVNDDMWQTAKWQMGDCRRDDIHIEAGDEGIRITSTCHD